MRAGLIRYSASRMIKASLKKRKTQELKSAPSAKYTEVQTTPSAKEYKGGLKRKKNFPKYRVKRCKMYNREHPNRSLEEMVVLRSPNALSI